MSELIRRDALKLFGVGGLAAALGLGRGSRADAATPADDAPQAAAVTGRLTTDHQEPDGDGRKLSGFVETGIRGGVALCTLAPEPGNPEPVSVCAAPAERSGLAGVSVRVVMHGSPSLDVAFSVLHIAADAGPASAQVLA